MRLVARVAAVIILFSISMIGQNSSSANPASSSEIQASYVDHELAVDAAHPAAEWQSASPVIFSSDWQGKNPDEGRETRLRVLWSKNTLYLRFECRYRELFVFADAEPNGRRDHLWDRDVAEAFLQPDPSKEHNYKEFEVSPNGMWIDLDIFPGGKADLKSGMQRSVVLDEKSHAWNAELAIPIKASDPVFRSQCDLEGEFLSRGRAEGTQGLFSVAAYEFAAAQFSRAERLRKDAIRRKQNSLKLPVYICVWLV